MENLTVIKNLISAMADYCLENSWTDTEFVNALIDLGITKEDFINCGYNRDYVKEYF